MDFISTTSIVISDLQQNLTAPMTPHWHTPVSLGPHLASGQQVMFQLPVGHLNCCIIKKGTSTPSIFTMRNSN